MAKKTPAVQRRSRLPQMLVAALQLQGSRVLPELRRAADGGERSPAGGRSLTAQTAAAVGVVSSAPQSLREWIEYRQLPVDELAMLKVLRVQSLASREQRRGDDHRVVE
jgi:hypothetical protein